MSIADYDVLDRALSEPRAPLAAAEAHGVLCGGLCAAEHYPLERWLEEVLGTEAATLPARNVLSDVYAETTRTLSEGEMEFAPLLPDDLTPLETRVAALAQWCEGYLYGVGVGDHEAIDSAAGEVGEVLRDFSEISRAGVGEDSEEVNESAYAELVEFVRAGTQLLYEELAAVRARGAPPSTRH